MLKRQLPDLNLMLINKLRIATTESSVILLNLVHIILHGIKHFLKLHQSLCVVLVGPFVGSARSPQFCRRTVRRPRQIRCIQFRGATCRQCFSVLFGQPLNLSIVVIDQLRIQLAQTVALQFQLRECVLNHLVSRSIAVKLRGCCGGLHFKVLLVGVYLFHHLLQLGQGRRVDRCFCMRARGILLSRSEAGPQAINRNRMLPLHLKFGLQIRSVQGTGRAELFLGAP